ncbi:TPA: hypothetical protein SIA29_003963 [Aeromonas sobria]|nr:hypothetical protein [Aeromonas sobria]HEH9433067.1 hypothetical protein [Aeromonas sobria]
MLEMIDGKIIQKRATGLGKLIKVVAFQFQLYTNILTSIYNEIGKPPTLEQIKEKHPDLLSVNIVAQVFTAMVIEAFYFDYYYEKTSKTRAEEWSKQSPICKFEQITSEFFHIENPKDLTLYKDLKELNTIRIRYIHNKSSEIGKSQRDLNNFSADGCIQLLREFFHFFAKNDPNCLVASLTYKSLTELQINEKGFSGKNGVSKNLGHPPF